MKQIEFFIDFYNDLNTPGIVLFWLIIVLFFFLFFSLIAVLLKNQELRGIIKNLKQNNEKTISNNLTVSKENVEHIKEANHIEKEIEPIEDITIKTDDSDVKENLENTSLYQKNMLKEIGTKNQTSPVSIGKTLSSDTMKIDKQKLEPIEIVEVNDINDEYYDSINDGKSSFVEEISKQVDEELDNMPIELTDFENDQEEDAIISYEELLRNAKLAETREERYNIDIDDDNDFLKELKSFRNNL